MPITQIDPKSALIVIDLQAGIMSLDTAHSSDTILQKSVTLVDAFRDQKLPIVLVNVAGTAPGRTDKGAGGALFPEAATKLADALNPQDNDHFVTKHAWGAFTGTDLDSYLKAQGVTQVVLCGIATSIGVESTARTAHELGYNITLAVDAMTDMSLASHEHSVTAIFPRLGETGTTDQILAKLAERKA